MTPDFNIADASTWPIVLRVEHLAAIYQRPIGAIKKACQRNTFVPAPYQRHPSYRWRKVDVLRDVEGARTLSLARRSA